MLTYTPVEGASGTKAGVEGMAVVTVLLQDNGGTENSGINSSDPVTFTIEVSSDPNNVPVAVNDAAEVQFNTSIDINVLSNDSDPDGDTIQLVGLTAFPSNGIALAHAATGIITYTPNQDYIGQDVFSYQITDGSLQATATVTVNVFSNVASASDDVPQAFQLDQNYPNPFNPSTTISYSLARPGYVQLNVFTASGRHVRTLVGEHQNAGQYLLSLDAGDLPSGMYLYTLTTDGFRASRVFTLLK
jgi:hypothetical protein